LITKKRGEYASYDLSLVNAAHARLEVFKEYYSYIKDNDIYYITCVLDPRVKTKWLKKNVPGADVIINRVKTFLKKAYPLEPELLEISRAKSQKKKKSMTFLFLEEYAKTVTTDNDIKRFFTTLGVKAVLDKKENQV
jgi:hypothetical protein